ncbi:hypothetical protein E2C01_035256 [Portunus trituberculatus]|uniref:Uncharacterized protein n=1 Tax=Portunus trituberculatus TaxID=210409 RepID=A0A5B7F8R2_PORTR|nr:hypothetical protein [Portunus trituberculatus]
MQHASPRFFQGLLVSNGRLGQTQGGQGIVAVGVDRPEDAFTRPLLRILQLLLLSGADRGGER